MVIKKKDKLNEARLGVVAQLPRKMPRIGLEPTHLAAPEPKSGVSTNFTTWALRGESRPELRFCCQEYLFFSY